MLLFDRSDLQELYWAGWLVLLADALLLRLAEVIYKADQNLQGRQIHWYQPG